MIIWMIAFKNVQHSFFMNNLRLEKQNQHCFEAARTAARFKVDRLEKAVEVSGECDGPELAGLRKL